VKSGNITSYDIALTAMKFIALSDVTLYSLVDVYGRVDTSIFNVEDKVKCRKGGHLSVLINLEPFVSLRQNISSQNPKSGPGLRMGLGTKWD
jgi:hypothetical protein